MRHRPDTGRRFLGSDLPGFTTRHFTAQIDGHAYRLRVLSDRQQFADPGGHGARLGISSAQWSLFGQRWPSERPFARAMALADITGKEQRRAMDDEDLAKRGRLRHDRRRSAA